MYEKGQGVTQDDAQAVKCFRIEADQGDLPAQYKLGFMYYDGRGVPRDYVQAHMWFNLSAAQCSEDEDEVVMKLRDLVAGMMTPQQIAQAQKLARNWKPTK
jgi:TPR repeat protein